MPEMGAYQAMDTHTLEWLNDEAHKRHLSRRMSNPFMKKVDPDGVHIIAFNFITNTPYGNSPRHEATIVRAMIMVKVTGRLDPMMATLDISLSNFLKLPRFAYDEEGDLVKLDAGERVGRTVIKRRDRASVKMGAKDTLRT